MDDREIASRPLDFEKRARDYPLLSLPRYIEWAKRKLREGKSEALIANLDSSCMWLLPDEDDTIADEDVEELLEDLKSRLGE